MLERTTKMVHVHAWWVIPMCDYLFPSLYVASVYIKYIHSCLYTQISRVYPLSLIISVQYSQAANGLEECIDILIQYKTDPNIARAYMYIACLYSYVFDMYYSCDQTIKMFTQFDNTLLTIPLGTCREG